VHEVNLYRFSQKDGSLLTNRTVFKTTSLEIANSTNCIVANSNEKALYICVPYTSKIILLNDSQKPVIAAESEANLLIEKCDLNLNAIWHATIEGYQSKSITKHALAIKNNCFLVSFFSVGFCNYSNGLNRPLICDYPFNSALLVLNTETSNLIQKQITEEFTPVCRNNFYAIDSVTLLSYTTANKFLTLHSVKDDLKLSSITKIPIIDFDIKSICCNYFTNELTLLFDYSKSMTLAGVPFTCTGKNNAALLKLKLSKYEIWQPYEDAPTTKISNEDYSLAYSNNKSRSLITIEYVNAEEKHINSGIYDFRGRIVKQLANDLQTKGTKQIYTSMNELPPGLYLFELNGKRKDILHY
jgi:hypothetical protein